MPNQISKYSGVIGSDTANTPGTIVERDANGDIYAAAARVTSVRNSGPLFIGQATKTAAYTVADTDYAVYVNTSTAAFTVTLPAVAANDGRQLAFVKVDSSTNVCTIDGNGSEAINGATAVSLTAQWDKCVINGNSTLWVRVV